MGIISRTGDLFYAFRFLKLLVTPWEKTVAFELGIIDENGKVLKKGSQRNTPEEKSAYTVFHRLVFNLKRLLNKLPFGKSKLASYASALFLIKEETGMKDKPEEIQGSAKLCTSFTNNIIVNEIPDVPTITTAPESITIIEGDYATFSITISDADAYNTFLPEI